MPPSSAPARGFSPLYPRLVHATCVAVEGRGVLLLGPSGSGKSDLALRLIDRGGVLVADDQVMVVRLSQSDQDQRLIATAPPQLVGMLEVRGIGILQVPYRESITLALAVDLLAHKRPLERLPLPAWWHFSETESGGIPAGKASGPAPSGSAPSGSQAGPRLPLIYLYPFDISAVERIRARLRYKLTET